MDWWYVRNKPPELGMWVSECCDRDLALIEAQEELEIIMENEQLGGDPVVFQTKEIGLIYFRERT